MNTTGLILIPDTFQSNTVNHFQFITILIPLPFHVSIHYQRWPEQLALIKLKGLQWRVNASGVGTVDRKTT
jgi:hypothetical protein